MNDTVTDHRCAEELAASYPRMTMWADTTKPNLVHIGRDAFAVATLAEAIGCWESARDQYGWGASDAPRCTATIDGEKLRISYNGRAWRADGSEVLP